jgi:hypothetical protein
MSKITVGCLAGIGNRLYSLLSTLNITINHNIDFTYWFPSQQKVWETTLNDLFTNSLSVCDYKSSEYEKLVSNQRIKTDWVLMENELNQSFYWHTPIASFKKSKPILSFKSAFNYLQIQEDLLTKINSMNITDDHIGIHIRGGDLKGENLHLDDTRLLDDNHNKDIMRYMNKELEANTDQTFFLSCEDEDDENLFIQEYGNKIIKLNNIVHNRSTKQGCKDAFVNLVLLSKCKHIVGNIGSSFANVAALVGDKKYFYNEINGN